MVFLLLLRLLYGPALGDFAAQAGFADLCNNHEAAARAAPAGRGSQVDLMA